MPVPPQVGNVKPHVRKAAKYINETFGVDNIGGYATSGHIPDSDHYKGLALDAMVGNNKSQGDKVANWAMSLEAMTKYRTKYVIWQGKYYDLDPNEMADGVGEPYTGSNPHNTHVHISFWAEDGGPGLEPPFDPILANPFSMIEDWFKENGLRIVMFIGGGVLVVVALVFAVRRGII